MAGVGKSSVGSAVAETLDIEFVDLDALISTLAHRSVSEIFAQSGEGEFRRLESEALSNALDSPRRIVIATGGGVVLDPANRELLTGRATVVWLRAGVDTVVDRIVRGRGSRPLIGDDVAASVNRLVEERSPLYGSIASLHVDTDGCGVGEVVERVVAALAATDATAIDPTARE